MSWYTAHLITYFKLKNAPQDTYTIWENVILVEAIDEVEALTKAQEYGELDAKLDAEDETLTVDDQPAVIIFAGVRKIVTVLHRGQEGTLESGDEVTFNEFVVTDKESIKKLVAGEEVMVNYIE
jgi:hypothetical protein